MTFRLAFVLPLVFATTALAEETAEARGPETQFLGIGIGWQFPAPLLEPNIATARFRVGGVTLEPSIRLAIDSVLSESEAASRLAEGDPIRNEDEERRRTTAIEVGGTVRYPFARRGSLALVGLGGVNVGWAHSGTDDDLRDETTVNETRAHSLNASLNWGLGIEWFMLHNLALSADARNPLLSWNRTTTTTHLERDTPVGRSVSDTETVNSTVSGALSFRPQVRVMVHLYF